MMNILKRPGQEQQMMPRMVVQPAPSGQRWNTKLCECGGPYYSDFAYSFFCTQCASAQARENVDGTPCVFSFFFSNPCFNNNVVRRRYGVMGDDGEDAIKGIFLTSCAVRQALSESKIRGRAPNFLLFNWGADRDQWNVGLCDCNCQMALALFFPTCVFASAREKFDGSSCCFNVLFGTPCSIYNMVRWGYGIEGDSCMDVIVPWFIAPCAAQRAYNESSMRWLRAQIQMVIESASCCCCCGGGGGNKVHPQR
jgi:hypothetical protein